MNALVAALQPLFAPAATVWGAPVTWLELVAFVLAIAMVVFNIRVNPLGWPLAIVSSLLYFALFWDNRLYGDASLQIFFAAVAGQATANSASSSQRARGASRRTRSAPPDASVPRSHCHQPQRQTTAKKICRLASPYSRWLQKRAK